MISIAQLCMELAKEKANLSKNSSRIERERANVQESIQLTQSFFSDQKTGQDIIRLLSIVQNDLIRADNALYALGSELTTYIADLQK